MQWLKACKQVWLLVLLAWVPAVQAVDKQTIGWLERVHIGETNIHLEAKVDTGADFSSINGNILATFTRSGEKWVRFQLNDQDNHTVVMERKVLRYANIKRKQASPIKRPVVMLGVCLGGIARNIEVNLADRNNFKYQMLIGRSYLHGFYLVDSALQYTTQPTCPGVTRS